MPDLRIGTLVARALGRCDWGRTIRPAAADTDTGPCLATPTQVLVLNGEPGRRVVQVCTEHGDLVDGHATSRLPSVALAAEYAGQLFALIAPAAARAAAALEEIRAAGAAGGLADEEITGVINAWINHYQARPESLPLDRVRVAVIARAAGGDWRPPADGVFVDPVRLNHLLHELGVAPHHWAAFTTPEATL
jgi:hypothetical protein